MWTATVGIKGGLDVGDDRWQWDLVYSHASYQTRETSINLKEEGIRDWILDGASTVVADPISSTRTSSTTTSTTTSWSTTSSVPSRPSDIDDLIGENVMRANVVVQLPDPDR